MPNTVFSLFGAYGACRVLFRWSNETVYDEKEVAAIFSILEQRPFHVVC